MNLFLNFNQNRLRPHTPVLNLLPLLPDPHHVAPAYWHVQPVFCQFVLHPDLRQMKATTEAQRFKCSFVSIGLEVGIADPELCEGQNQPNPR